MATKNDITGDAIKTKASNDAYRDNFDSIFNWFHQCSEVGNKELMLPNRSQPCKLCGATKTD